MNGRAVRPAQEGQFLVSVMSRKVILPSSGTASIWILKPLPSPCVQAVPTRGPDAFLAFAVAHLISCVGGGFGSGVGIVRHGILLRLFFGPRPSRPDGTGKEAESVRERQRPGKLKIGGDLQGEPIFCLPARRRLHGARQSGRGVRTDSMKRRDTT